ncbi:MAG: S1C family serine protease [Candidatus Saccharimonadales bacterium]
MQKKTKRTKQVVIVTMGILLIALVGGGIGAWLVAGSDKSEPLTSLRNTEDDGNTIMLESEESIAKVAQKISPSVVSITTTSSGRQMLQQQGAGTGIIVSKDGYVVTNKHVVSGAQKATVSLSDGDIYEDVTVVGTDPLNDIAFLKINGASNLTPAEIGESSTLRIGQTVVAIGNSLGEFQNTVTSGIVSGLGRPVAAQSGDGQGVESLTDLIQTDAAINPGNSGGPLVNLAGQVVGINTAVASDAQGIGFAIPFNAVKGVLSSVLETGQVERAYIGVRYVDITPAIAKERKLSVKRGALVVGSQGEAAVEKDGPADKAGVKEGDIIVKIGDLTVGENGGMSSLVGEYRPGANVKVTVLRDGREQELSLTLAAYQDAAEADEAAQEAPSSNRGNQTPSLRDLFGF